MFFFFKQKTAYEMRISDWSSDVCSSDLLLIAMHDVARVVDIQRDRCRRGGIAGAVDVDHRGHHAGQFARSRCIFPPAHRRLAGQPRARFRQLAERQAEAWIVAQSIEILDWKRGVWGKSWYVRVDL